MSVIVVTTTKQRSNILFRSIIMGKSAISSDLMFACLGNGISVVDKNREEFGDYMRVAHINVDRTVSIRSDVNDKDLHYIKAIAATSEARVSATQQGLALHGAPVCKPEDVKVTYM